MIRKGEKINETERPQPAGQRAAIPQSAARSRPGFEIERAERQFSALVASSTTPLSVRESFITEWADS